ncbi:Ubiquitin-conjugating enzyme E2 22 [Carex littledalei]|uniref:Ubiquitin-conjugating enzyme E2 22 n=1 Tax=Carex littledalei TaxID=544730 RepID=A0A833QY15_9POAL|nr:Ubiquitin-conjugating enzyme E2 22 [Carex littledalei]
MTKLMATNENLPPNVIKQLAKELKNLDESPPEGIKVSINDDDFSTIFADIEGPSGTPYENGTFRMKLLLSHDFPQSPPKGYFLTKIFHPNIATNGEICVNTLKKDWNPSLGLRHVLIVSQKLSLSLTHTHTYACIRSPKIFKIADLAVWEDFFKYLKTGLSILKEVVRCLLIEPFPESALNEQAGKMLLENYDEYARHARLYTGIHAKPKSKSKSGAISESTTALNVDPSSTNNNALGGKKLPPGPTPLTASSKGIATNSNDQNIPVVTGPSAPFPKKESGTAKALADKKKIDARKKSLKRL